MDNYPRMVTPSTPPFDPLKLAEATRRVACRSKDRARKYTSIYLAGVYRGIATAYAVGCPLRCIFCWVDDSREYPERRGRFYTPGQVLEELLRVARRAGINRARVSGAEPTLCPDHLLELLSLVEDSPLKLFILETNGVILGADPEYAKRLADYEKVHIRLSLKAATPEGFRRRTGASPDSYLLPFKAIGHLLEAGASFHVAAMTDPRLMPPEERSLLLRRLKQLHPELAANLEEEVCDPYPATMVRLAAAGVDAKAFFRRNKPIY